MPSRSGRISPPTEKEEAPERSAPRPRAARRSPATPGLLRRSGGGRRCLLRLRLGLLLRLLLLLVGLLLGRLGVGGRLLLGARAERDECEGSQGSGDGAHHGRLLGLAGKARRVHGCRASAMPGVHHVTSRRNDWHRRTATRRRGRRRSSPPSQFSPAMDRRDVASAHPSGGPAARAML